MFAIFGRCLKSRRKKKTWNFNFVMVMHGYVGDCDRDLIVIVMYLKDADKEDSTRVADRPPVDHHKQRFQPGEVFGHLEIRWSPFKFSPTLVCSHHWCWRIFESLNLTRETAVRTWLSVSREWWRQGLWNDDMAWPLDHLCICHLDGYGYWYVYGFRDKGSHRIRKTGFFWTLSERARPPRPPYQFGHPKFFC